MCVLATYNVAFAQNEDIKNNINNIKRDTTTYIWGETTSSNKEEAFDMARNQLHINIELWVKQILPNQEINSVVAKKIDNYCQQFSLMRGKQYRAFVYVNKNDIYALLPVNSVSVISENKTQPAPSSSETMLVNTNHPSIIMNNEDRSVSVASSPHENLLQDLFKVHTLSGAKEIINSDKYRSKYYYGNVKSANDGRFIKEKNAILIIYKRHNKDICAIVQSNKSGSLVNLKTGKPDALANYSDCDAIWVVKTN